MKNKIYLISEQTLKSESLINDNCDSIYILPAIQLAQDQGLQNIIGTVLYDKLKTLVGENKIGNEENRKYKDLLDDYITPYLIWLVTSDIQIPLAYKMRNSGIIQSNNEHEQNAYIKDAQTLKTYYDQKASFYANRLSDYLIANESIYPEFTSWRDVSDMKAKQNAYNTGIYLGGSKRCACEDMWFASVINDKNI